MTAIGAASIDKQEIYAQWIDLLPALEAGAWLFYITDKELCVVTIPDHIHVDQRRRRHSANGPAFSVLDIKDYYWHGVRVPAEIIEHPERITVSQIEAERNAELRRVLIERYGEGRYLLDSGTKPVQHDAYGTLYRQEFPDGLVRCYVEVINATPEPDMTRRKYWLKVPPTIRTAHEGVAWSFYMTPDQYHPRYES